MIDIDAKLRELLGKQTEITAIFGERIYIARSLPAGYKVADGPALLAMVRGGSQAYSSQMYWPSVQFRCYAGTEQAARAAGRALYDALNDTQARGCAWIRMEEGTLPVLMNEPGSNWPYMLAFFTLAMQNL
jgi:hypothetical protein